jgi:hypothetical protein
MLKLTNPRLRRFNVVGNSFSSCISNTPKELSRTPEVSFSEIFLEPFMFFKKFKGCVAFKELEGLANTNSWGEFNKEMDMISSNIEFINLEPSSISNLSNEKLTFHPESVKLEGISCVFNFPDKMESILSEAMLPRFQIHFSSPDHRSNYDHEFISGGLVSRPSDSNHSEELNFEDGDSSQNLKVWVSSP